MTRAVPAAQAGRAATSGRSRRLSVLRLFPVGFFLASLFAPLSARATIRYVVSVAGREQHLFHVTMTVPAVHEELVVRIPGWNALYQIRDFAYHVLDVEAREESPRANWSGQGDQLARLPVTKLDQQTWRITGDGTVTIDYRSYWDEAGPFSSQLNTHHAFINFADILFYVPDRRREQVEVRFTDAAPEWRVAVELPPGSAAGSFAAPNYDALVDAPAELGTFKEFRLAVNQAQLRVAVDGEGWDQGTLRDTLERIVAYETKLMREVPFTEYLFLYRFGEHGGGMEHANSTAIRLENPSQLAGVTAHEFFHLWNVKRIRPQSLEPVDYSREQGTRALWFAEGVTNTYAAYTLERAGLWNKKQFYDDLALEITELESQPARRWKSVEEASLDTWLDKYPFYHRPDVSISYYNKGQILGVLLDLEIRDASENHASLDDVMRYLNENFAHRSRFYRDSADIRAAAEHFTGRSLADFFTRYVSGTDEIPYDRFLGLAGLALKVRGPERAGFGFLVARDPEGGMVVVAVESGGAAEAAGVREGDIPLAVNGETFPDNPERWLRDHRPGETVEIGLRREGAAKAVSFALGAGVGPSYEIEEIKHPSERQRRIREGWLRGTTD